MKRSSIRNSHNLQRTMDQATKDTLTRKAGLTSVSQMLQQGARLLVGFVVTPIVIRGLGAELYGAWGMIQQSIGYLSLSDLRPIGTLKFTLMVRQHLDDFEEKRRQIASALIVWIFTLPIFLILGGIAVWKLPAFIRVSPDYLNQIRLAIAIVAISVAIDRVLSLPANVLRGVNLEYKAMGLNAVVILLNGGLVAVAIWMNLGLPGLAGASVLGIFISGIVRLFVAKGALSWFGISKPERNEFVKFAKLTAWLTFSSLSTLLLMSSDLLLVGFLLGPASAAVYAITGMVLRMTTEPVAQLLGSANAGIAGICGQGDWKRAMKIRSEMFTLGIACIVFLGMGILALNKAFIGLWVGQEYFGGQVLNLFLVLAATGRLFFRLDYLIITSMLELKRMAISMFIAGALVIILGYGLISIWGLTGMACATSLGYFSQWGYYQFIIRNRFGLSMKSFFVRLSKFVFTTIPILSISYLSFHFLIVHGWINFISVTSLLSIFILCYVWFLLLDHCDRGNIIFRAKSIFNKYAA